MSNDTMVLIAEIAFDNGELRQDPDMASKMMASLLATMRSENPPLDKTPLIEVHDTIWERLMKVRTLQQA